MREILSKYSDKIIFLWSRQSPWSSKRKESEKVSPLPLSHFQRELLCVFRGVDYMNLILSIYLIFAMILRFFFYRNSDFSLLF